MPYEKYKQKKGEKMIFCMRNKESGKTYCYKSMADREEGMKMHEKYAKEMIKK